MTGQDGGFREAAARFRAEVQSALTRARRAAGEAKAQSGDFRKGTAELAEQARAGRLRGVRGRIEPTSADARDEAEKFRNANGLSVVDVPGADELLARLPGEERAERPPAPDDEDFSQRLILVDADARDEEPEERDVPEVPETAGIDSPAPENARSSDEDEDFSQQRILIDATVESYRPDSLTTGLFELPEPENPS
jgi:hypothetical protein